MVVVGGVVFRLDHADLGLLNGFTWSVADRYKNGRPYLVGRKQTGSKAKWYFHELVCPVRPGTLTDHRNRDTTDNRRANLRPATYQQNRANSGPNKGRQYKGVYRHGNRYKAQIKVSGRTIYLGLRVSQEEAARLYDQAARKHFGAYAGTNYAD